MDNWQKKLIGLLAVLLTVCLSYLVFSNFFFIDFATSLEPGWHTTIFSPHASGAIVTILLAIVVLAITAYFVYKYLFKLLTYIWLKIFPLH
jgi:hypothetical protein